MDTQNEYSYTPSSSDVVLALVDFARIAQHVLVGDAAGSHEEPLQHLLSRLLHLCGVQRGALLLSTLYHADAKRSFWSSLAERQTLRALARQGLDDDDLFALLATFASSRDEQMQIVLSDPRWMISQWVIPAPGASLHSGSVGLFNGPFTSTQRFFFLSATDLGTLSYQATVDKGRAVWPLVADAVGSVIVSLLQMERVYELEMTTSHRDIQQMELLKAELLASVSHELRSPLASVKGYVATLLRHERRISREERHEFLIAIQDASQRLEVVVDRLLETSQLETATLPLKRVSVNLVDLVRKAISARERYPAEVDTSTMCTFMLRVEDSLGRPTDEVPLLQADQRLLREVLDHLLENAALYSPQGGKVEVGLRTREPDNVHLLYQRLSQTPVARRRSTVVFPQSWPYGQPVVEIWVRDHGIGIPSAHLERIFHRFYRVDTSLTREVNGLGLGLAICKQIVELHDGILWAESEVGKGSTFHVLLPTNGQALSSL